MVKRKLWLHVLMVGALIGVTACGGGQSSSNASGNEMKTVTIGSATAGGTVYTLALGVADLISQKALGVKVTAEETGGGMENFNLLEKGDLDIAHSPPDVALKALAGAEPFKQPLDITLGWRFPDTTLHIAVKDTSGISSMSDLKGKRISIGAAGGATFPVNTAVLTAHGIKEGDYTPAYLSFTESVEALSDGAIDVALIWGSVPTANIQSLVSQKGIHLLSVDPDKLKGIKDVPVQADTIKAGTYNGIDKDVIVTLYSNFAFIDASLSEDVVYEMAKALDGGKEELAKRDPRGKDVRIANEEDVEFIGIQLHPGVARYLKEK
ncbi:MULTISPECIES: TAXI family TRAP transporter solute-binding subunit [unclassified Paenibacillus]|uniref:TAXI family TRAP transporter solute-binding subunit n=1 Tax=unclassified Paenibacillus TaxID=185978 RepID=UPI001AE77543|nr:TRAP transporter TAXI family solute receptor [Paenibacillus sp. PvP091]MBP1172091.1 TRAP transporter TAXI family solute receptor [Paenibacillus sp. PvR098]MBP2438472.1 TRAP transporter TAXI family solute receptor [Paenibacillus sp. PvP052]